MNKPYKPRRNVADRVAASSLISVIILCVAWLIFSGESDIDGKMIPVDKPVEVAETTEAVDAEPVEVIEIIEELPTTDAPEPDEPEPTETLTYLGEYQVYGYNFNDAKQCGKAVANGITASGEKAIHGKTCAMSKDIPFGTVVYIEGLGYFTVNDRGVGRGVVDIAFDNDKDCYAVTGRYDIYIVENFSK